MNMDFRESRPSENEIKDSHPFVVGDVSPLHGFKEPGLADGQKVSSVLKGIQISRQEYQAYKGGNMKFYVWGLIHYQDIGGEIEERSFCRYAQGFLATPQGEEHGGYGKTVGKDCEQTTAKN
jgi:hypothetical protein